MKTAAKEKETTYSAEAYPPLAPLPSPLHVDIARRQQAPLHPRELSHEERASLVQAATAVLSEARDKKILSYNDLFLLHEQDTLEKLARLQNSHHVWWDHEEILLDAIAAYFGK